MCYKNHGYSKCVLSVLSKTGSRNISALWKQAYKSITRRRSFIQPRAAFQIKRMLIIFIFLPFGCIFILSQQTTQHRFVE